MDMKERFDRLDHKIDKMDEKLDLHLERLTRAEESIVFIKGHLKFSLSLAIAIVGSLVGYLFKL